MLFVEGEEYFCLCLMRLLQIFHLSLILWDGEKKVYRDGLSHLDKSLGQLHARFATTTATSIYNHFRSLDKHMKTEEISF